MGGQRVTTFDSLPTFTAPFYNALIRRLMERLREVGVRTDRMQVVKHDGCSCQSNSVDCGPMALIFLKNRLLQARMDVISPQDVKNFRVAWSIHLLNSSELGKRILDIFHGNFLRACAYLYNSCN